MNLLSRKQIADLIQKSQQYVGVHIKRGHLIERAKRIDTDSKINKKFLSKFILKELEKPEPEKTSNTPKPTNGKIQVGNIDYIKKQYDIKLIQIKIKKEKLDLSKKQAKLIELLEAKEIMSRAIVTLSSQYRQNSKLYLMELAAKYSIPDTEIAGIQKNFDNYINKAVKESKNLIKTECKIVSDSYSESLNVGESE